MRPGSRSRPTAADRADCCRGGFSALSKQCHADLTQGGNSEKIFGVLIATPVLLEMIKDVAARGLARSAHALMDGVTATAIWAYAAAGAGQVSVEEGESLHVLARDNDEWWYVRADAGDGYLPASYVQVDVGSDAASDAGSTASGSVASVVSSAGSGAGSLSRFMKSAHGKKKQQQVQQHEQIAQTVPAAAAGNDGNTAEANATTADEKLLQLEEQHAQSLTKLKSENQQQMAAHEAEVTQLKAALHEAAKQNELDALELKATRAALTVAEDATAATQRVNEQLQTATAEHVQTEMCLRAEIDSLHSELEQLRTETSRLRRANAAASTERRVGSTTSARTTVGSGSAGTKQMTTTVEDTTNADSGSSPTRPHSAPVDRASGQPMASQPRWTALDASDTEPSRENCHRRGNSGGIDRPGSATSRRLQKAGAGAAAGAPRRGNGKAGRSRATRQINNMRPQSAPARQALSELSTAMFLSNPPELGAQQRVARRRRRRHYSKPNPPSGSGAKRLQQPSDTASSPEAAYVLMSAATDLSDAMVAENPSEQTLGQEQPAGGESKSRSKTSRALGSSNASATSNAAAAAARQQFASFEDRVASLLKAPGSRQRPPPPPGPSAVWGRLQQAI